MRFTKRKEMKRLYAFIACFFICILFFSSTLYANWNIYKQAQIRNSKKDYLRFDTSNGKTIMVWLIVKNKGKGVFSKKLPKYRVDNNDIHQIAKGKSYNGLKISKGRWIRWIISNAEKPSKELQEFINGKEVVFQYYSDDGKIMESVFSLEGIKEAIAEL